MSVENCFETARGVSGNPAWHKFSQGAEILDQIQHNQLENRAAGGLCGGVSLAYLGLLKSGTDIFDLAANNSNALWQYINKNQQHVMHATMEQCEFELAGGRVGLAVHARSIKFNCPVSNSMGGWVASNTGYFLIGCPNHYCAAVNSAAGLRFFDPNTGEAAFGAGAGAHLTTFISKYFTMGEVAKLYKLENPNVVYLTWYK